MPLFQPGCPSGMASHNGVMAQRGAQLHPLLLALLWQDWLLQSPLTGAHLGVCTAPCTRQCERLCSHIPQRPRPVQLQPSLGMTWIHFKSAVIHPGLAPGLSAHLPVVLPALQPLSCRHSWVLGLPGAACSPSLSCCPWSQALPAPFSTLLCLGTVSRGPAWAFPAAHRMALGSRSDAPTASLAHPALHWLFMSQPGPKHWARNREWFSAGSDSP